MLPQPILDRFVKKCPAVVMVRATIEHLIRPERLDGVFTQAAQWQYHKRLLFSDVVSIMAAVVLRSQMSVHAAYQASRDRLGVSPAALYAKLNHMEPRISEQVVRNIAAEAGTVIRAMGSGATFTVLPGLNVYYLDGNHLAGTEHRLAVTRATREGVLPGQSLALLDAQTRLITELILCEDGHSQERVLLPRLLERVAPGSVIVGDRNFCTGGFFMGLASKQACFLIRQHASTLTYNEVGTRKKMGVTQSGVVYEQELELTHEGQSMRVRRVTIDLYQPTEAGDTQIHVVTNLAREQAAAVPVAEAYRTRWTIERAFQQMTDVLRCEVRTLGYPKAALFAFAVAAMAYNVHAVVKAALRAAHGAEKIEEKFSDYHLVNDVSMTYRGMEIVVEEEEWGRYGEASAGAMAVELVKLACTVDLRRYPKIKRGPKKPRVKRKSGRKNHHVATARLLRRKRDTP